MSLKNTANSYGSFSKFLHWTVFIFVLTLVTVGVIMVRLPESSPWVPPVYNIHKLAGLTVLTLMLLRLLWISFNVKPTLPNTIKPWEKKAEHFIHVLFYITLIAMPLSGWVMTTAAGYIPYLFDWSLPFPGISENKSIADFFEQIHYWLAWTISGLITIHVLAALKHHFIDKDNVLKRMLPWV